MSADEVRATQAEDPLDLERARRPQERGVYAEGIRGAREERNSEIFYSRPFTLIPPWRKHFVTMNVTAEIAFSFDRGPFMSVRQSSRSF